MLKLFKKFFENLYKKDKQWEGFTFEYKDIDGSLISLYQVIPNEYGEDEEKFTKFK